MCDFINKPDPSSFRAPIILSAPENHSKKRIFENTPKTSPFKINDASNGFANKGDFSGKKLKPAKKKLKCLFHKDSKITNFCTNPNCLMPLCSYCMEDHLNKHHETQTKPQIKTYDNVREDTLQRITNSISLINNNKELFSNLKFELDARNLNLNKQLVEMKNFALQIIDKYFSNLQTSLNERMKQEYLHNKANLDEIERTLLENEKALQKTAAKLAEGDTTTCKHIILVYKDNILDNTERFASQIEDRINIMRETGIQLRKNEGELEGLQACLTRSFFLAREEPNDYSHFNDQDFNPKIHLLPNPKSNNPMVHNNFRPIQDSPQTYKPFSPPPFNYPNSPSSYPPSAPYLPAVNYPPPPPPSSFPPPSYPGAPLSYPHAPLPPPPSSFPPPPPSSFPPPSSSLIPPYPYRPASYSPPFGLTSSTFSPSVTSFISGERGGLSRSEVNYERKPNMRMDAQRISRSRL